jgi:hypothetical protein
LPSNHCIKPSFAPGEQPQRGQSRQLTIPHSKTSPTSRGTSRISRQRLGVRLWAPALHRFRMPDGRSSSAPTSPPARKRRIRSAPSPHSKTSPTSHGASRTSRQRLGVRSWAPALHRFRMPDGRSSSALPPHPPESGESAPLHRRTPIRRRLPTGLPDPRASVLECGCGRSPLPLSDAGQTLIQRTTSPPARKRRIRAAPSPHSNTSPPSHGASRTSRQRLGVRLWAKPSTAFDCRTDDHPAHYLPTRPKSGESALLRQFNYSDASLWVPMNQLRLHCRSRFARVKTKSTGVSCLPDNGSHSSAAR